MTNWFLMSKEGLSTILHHISFFTEKFVCSPESTKNFDVFFWFFLQGGFVILDIVFGCDDSTYNPSPVRELSLVEFENKSLLIRLYALLAMNRMWVGSSIKTT